MLGQYVNNYEIISLLGEGGMGAVYAAEHRLIGRKVAIKILKRDLAGEPEVVQRFLNEARAIGAIRHPNIIEIIDVGKLGTVPFLVMELLHGESLAERVARMGSLAFAVAVDFVSQATRALQVAHESGVVHRDLKPENLFILTPESKRETIKVLDFGIAKLRDDLTATPVRTRAGSLLGTPLYMSPEQCRGLDELDLRTDVYSLGVILYEAICGTPPFLAKSIGEVMRMHMFDEPERPSHKRPGVPAQLEHVILKCLAKDPQQRYADMLQLQAALELSGLATTELDTPAPSSLAPVAVDVTAPRARGVFRSWPLQIALWCLVLSLAALGMPDQNLPLRPLGRRGPGIVASALQLPAAVVVALLPAAAPPKLEPVQRPAAPAHVVNSRPATHLQPPAARRPEPPVPPPVENIVPLPAPALQPGYLSLDSAPWAEVFLGGDPLGTTPLIHVPLPPGRHQLTLRNTELNSSTTYVVEIKSGQSLARLVGWGR